MVEQVAMEDAMTVPREPDNSRLSGWSDEDQRLRASMAAEVPPRPAQPDDEGFLQAYPAPAEGPARVGRIALYAIAALLIVGAVLYGATRNGTTTASNRPAANTAVNSAQPAQPPLRNVTPGPNAQPGITTGAAPRTPAPANPSAPDPGAPPR